MKYLEDEEKELEEGKEFAKRAQELEAKEKRKNNYTKTTCGIEIDQNNMPTGNYRVIFFGYNRKRL